ncbi:hypothetical protein T492DRAFT_1053435 [Pavlovales sp. CCMP2436]|nr:hypothetical protein T492DRAFT_1053435 [Pavlovales sp. CCMP2436]
MVHLTSHNLDLYYLITAFLIMVLLASHDLDLNYLITAFFKGPSITYYVLLILNFLLILNLSPYSFLYCV